MTFKLFVARKSVQDPAEAWEEPYTDVVGGFYFRGNYAGHPYVPKKPDELPAEAFELLHDHCGVEELGRTLIIPSSVRAIGQRNRRVITPQEVLAVGERAVSLWAEKPLPGVKISISLDELSAIEDVHILLYGRLSFVSRDQRLTIRYNTVCRRALEPLLARLRKAMAGPALRVPQKCSEGAAIPFKWNYLLNYPFSTLDDKAPRDFRFSREAPRRRAGIARGHMMIMTPYELISLRDPSESDLSYGVDSLFIPRARIQGVALAGNRLEITANGASFTLPLTPALRETVGSWFAAPALVSA